MYWTDAGTDKIQRANLDGTGVQDLVTGLPDPYDIALDVTGGKMYWTHPFTARIQRANLDGTGVEDLWWTSEQSLGIALDIPASVGGIAELPDVAGTPLEAPDSSGRDVGFLVGVVAVVAAGVVTLASGAWYARRRRLR